MYYFRLSLFIVGLITLFNGCSKQISEWPGLPTSSMVKHYSSSSMILVDQPYSTFLQGDDLSRKSLQSAISQSLVYLKRIPAHRTFRYGKLEYSAKEVIVSFRLFRQILEANKGYEQLISDLEQQFLVFKSSANSDQRVLFTGYYEPIFKGSLSRTSEYSIPVYSLPDDLLVLKLGGFRNSLQHRTIVYRNEDSRIVPYYSRREIMELNALEGKNLEIAWMRSPVDLFFLQVQGSGILVLPSGKKIRLSYNGSNGRNYSSIGKMLVDDAKMTLEEVSMDSIRRYIAEHPNELKSILYHNESYTFFNIGAVYEEPRGNINVPLTPNRSIATDTMAFPKAGLAYISSELPVFDKFWNPVGTKPFVRFVVNQDTGGAIKGPGRVDLFWGNGKRAEKSAGKMRSMGRLYFFVAKKEVLLNHISLNSL